MSGTDKKIEKIKHFRLFLLKQIEGLNAEQLNTVPPGFNNNIIWNLGHLICVQQNLCYARVGIPVIVEDQYFSPYMPGTKPSGLLDETQIKAIKDLLISSLDRLQIDCNADVFKNYSPSVMIPKVYGFEVGNVDEAIDYLLHHEGLHAGFVMSMKRII